MIIHKDKNCLKLQDFIRIKKLFLGLHDCMSSFSRTNFPLFIKSAASTALKLFTVQFGMLASGIIFQIILNRQLGAGFGGLFALASALSLLFSVFVDFGYDLIIPQRIAQHHNPVKVLEESIIVKIMLWFGGISIFCPIIIVMWINSSPDQIPGIFLLYFFWVLPRTITMSLTAGFRGLLHINPISVVENVLTFIGYSICISLLLIDNHPSIILGSIIIIQITTECGKIFWLSEKLRYYNADFILFSTTTFGNYQFVKRFWQLGMAVVFSKAHWGFVLTQCLSTIESRLGIYLLGIFTSQTEVGYFAAVQRILSLTRIIPGSIFQGLLPHFSASISFSNFSRLLSIISLIGLVGSFILWRFAEHIINVLYGKAFLPAVDVLLLCSWMFVAQMILHTLEALLLAGGKTHYVNILVAFFIAIVIILHLIFIPALSAFGTAQILLIAQFGLIFCFLLNVFQIRKKIFY